MAEAQQVNQPVDESILRIRQPYSPESERAVLSSIMVCYAVNGGYTEQQDRIWDVGKSLGLKQESFFDPRNRTVFAAMEELASIHAPLVVESVINVLKESFRLESIGGTAYIQSLFDMTSTCAHGEYHMYQVMCDYRRRLLIGVARKAVEDAMNSREHPDPVALIGCVERDILDIPVGFGQTVPWTLAVDRTVKKLKEKVQNGSGELEGLSTGIKSIDSIVLGLRDSEMIVVGARPSVGKTSLAMNFVEHLAVLSGVPVLVFSKEMDVDSLARRMVAGMAGINLAKIASTKLKESEKPEILESIDRAYEKIRTDNIHVDDESDIDIETISARARRAKREFGIRLVVIDYLQLCRSGALPRGCDEYTRISVVSQTIKAMAKQLKLPVVVAAQLRRLNDSDGAADGFKEAKMSDLRGSGGIEQDADVIMLLHKTQKAINEGEPKGGIVTVVNVAKNRNGEPGQTEVVFDRTHTRFLDRVTVTKLPWPAKE